MLFESTDDIRHLFINNPAYREDILSWTSFSADELLDDINLLVGLRTLVRIQGRKPRTPNTMRKF